MSNGASAVESGPAANSAACQALKPPDIINSAQRTAGGSAFCAVAPP